MTHYPDCTFGMNTLPRLYLWYDASLRLYLWYERLTQIVIVCVQLVGVGHELTVIVVVLNAVTIPIQY